MRRLCLLAVIMSSQPALASYFDWSVTQVGLEGEVELGERQLNYPSKNGWSCAISAVHTHADRDDVTEVRHIICRKGDDTVGTKLTCAAKLGALDHMTRSANLSFTGADLQDLITVTLNCATPP